MTTSGRGKKSSTEPPAEAGAGPGGTVPENERELRQEIKQTREQLGDTVEQLVAKTDMKGRARAKAADLTGRVKGKSALARSKAADRGAGVRGLAAGKTLIARQKAAVGRDQLQARASAAWQTAPEGVRSAVTKGANIARQRRVPLAATLLTLASGYLAVRWWRGRKLG